MMRLLFLLAGMLSAHALLAAPTLEKVVDGDTVILLEDGQRYRMRLMDIDAPELAQAGGKLARRSLIHLCAQATLTVMITGQDRYGRVLGYLYCDEQEANAWQIAQGMAWFNRRYSTRLELETLEAQARAQGLGIWQSAQPVPPWQWRKQHGRYYRRQE